ncbi:PREDICTED: cleft lip and palate transmembrane protein 1-like protein [Rhagoletis zephyria]|uniref:cleft lip and palate transmembrane protein 1-like protein n=1 Tax=Rhagoletis zephyria TaxID=28612 RepID=UPI0008117051|nr:PREDICTED: cleft lip and palate transmembrane protein 1-like protein [Rhagoletis zephyria]
MPICVVLALKGEPLDWRTLRRDGPTVILPTRLTEYTTPRVEAFNLLGDSKDKSPKNYNNKKNPKQSSDYVYAMRPVTHIMSQVHVNLLTDNISLSKADVPPEMARLIQINRNHKIMPILKTDFFNTRLKNLVEVTKNTTEFKITFHYTPIGIGKLRLMLMVEHTMQMMETIGFSKKDIDELKGMFSDTNAYLLCGTIFVASVHLLFDFLSFKNDVIFWRRKKSYEGLSTRTTLWRAFSQIVIFLYLLDENTSMLVLIPAGLGVVIELWKCKKILKLQIGLTGLQRMQSKDLETSRSAEKRTEEFDKEGMKYLSYLLYPLCIAGAVYSLLYQPHKSWYSWTLNSLVNGVYAFGFLFMLPQLFVNYKLKSVAALPWRAFMYKAFNTFIDDFFAFIITMPTAHRVACLRDDVVFLIYLYQRWLYPVDNSRLDTGLAVEENTHTDEAIHSSQIANDRKNK